MSNSTDKTSDFLALAKDHYENFPVASFLIPKNYRKDIAIVYWFARTADDLADEGIITPEIRIERLNQFEFQFRQALKQNSNNANFNKLAETIVNHNISENYFIDLLSAFKQDAAKNRYNNYNELLDYCSRSANPIGRILLEIFKISNPNAIKFSDNICTALQLTNFYQDTIIDYQKGRIYFPQDEMKMFSVTEKMFELKENNSNIKELVKYNIDRTQQLFDEGGKLLSHLSGRFKYEILWTLSGGEKILSKIRKSDYNVLNHRPSLNKIDFIKLLIKSFINV